MTQTTKKTKSLFEVLNPKAKSEKKFKDKHVTIKHKDPAGNGDDVFNASNIKTAVRMKDNHGYDAGGHDEKVYESAEDLSELTVKNKSSLKNIGYKLMHDYSQKDTAKRIHQNTKSMSDGELVRIHHSNKNETPDRGSPRHFQHRAVEKELSKRNISKQDYDNHVKRKHSSMTSKMSQKNESNKSVDYKMIPTVVNGKVIFKKVKKDLVVEDMHSNTIHVGAISGKVNGKKFKVPTHVDTPHDEKHIAKHNVHLNPKDVKTVSHHLKKLLEEKSCKYKKKKELKEALGNVSTPEYYDNRTGKLIPSKMKKGELSAGAKELINHANNYDHVKRAARPFIENMRRRMHKGTYDKTKGHKLWHNYAKHIALSYHAEYMPHEDIKKSLPQYKDDINQVAAHFEKKHRYAIQNGLHESALWYSELSETNKDKFDTLLESSKGLKTVLGFIDNLENISESAEDAEYDSKLAKKHGLPVKKLKNQIGVKAAFLQHKGDHVSLHNMMTKAGFKKSGSKIGEHSFEQSYEHSDGSKVSIGSVGEKGRSIIYKKGK